MKQGFRLCIDICPAPFAGFGFDVCVVLLSFIILFNNSIISDNKFYYYLIANGVVLSITLYQRKSLKQSSTIFFTSLILAHLVLNLLYLPFTIIALAAGEWIFGSTDEEKRRTCFFAAFIYWWIALVILMTIAAISFDRLLFIVKPHLHKWYVRSWAALSLTIVIWLLSAVFCSTPFYGLGIFSYSKWLGFC